MSIDKDTKWNNTSEEFVEQFLDKWIKDTKMEEMYRIQNELKEKKNRSRRRVMSYLRYEILMEHSLRRFKN
jgi:hypothetical protein